MKHKKILLSTITAVSLINSSLLANETTKLDDVNVWETQVISSSLNLGEKTIETKQADHLSDLLRDLPGVDVGGTHSINNRINIRGLQDDNLDITLDGAKVQNANMFHHIGNLLINPDILKKADIQVGTNSVVNGSLGGSVAFETKDGKDMLEKGKNFGARVSTTYNSNDSLGGSISAYGKVDEKISFLLYHNYIDRGNWEKPDGKENYGIEGKNNNTLIKASYDITDNQSVSISYDLLTDEGDYLPRPNFSSDANYALNGANLTFDTKYQRETITLKHNLNLGDNLVLNTSIYNNENNLKRYETWVGRSPRPSLNGMLDGKVETSGINTKAQTNAELGDAYHTFTYGGVFDKQTSKVKWGSESYGDDEEAKTFALYVEDTIDFNNGLLLTPGVRYNNYKYDGVYGNISDNEVTYGLSTEYSVTDNLTLLASATTLYKGVEMVDVLDSTRVSSSIVNDLNAETGINKEVGFKYIDNNLLGADSIGVMFKYFNTDIKDYINTDWSTGNAVKYNDGELNLKGFEASFKYAKDKLDTLLTYAHSSSSYENSGKPTDYEPGDSISINIDYKLTNEVDLAWTSLYTLKEKDVISTYGIENKKSYDVHNVAVNYNPNTFKNLSMTFGVDNMFNEKYISHTSDYRYARGVFLGDYEAGRNFKVTLAYKF